MKAISCYYVAINHGRTRKFFAALLHLLCSGLPIFIIFSKLNFIFSPDIFFSPKAENLALFLASLRLSW